MALRICKDLMKRPQRDQLEQAVARELQEFAVRVRSAETKEAITAFFEKRPPGLYQGEGGLDNTQNVLKQKGCHTNLV